MREEARTFGWGRRAAWAAAAGLLAAALAAQDGGTVDVLASSPDCVVVTVADSVAFSCQITDGANPPEVEVVLLDGTTIRV